MRRSLATRRPLHRRLVKPGTSAALALPQFSVTIVEHMKAAGETVSIKLDRCKGGRIVIIRIERELSSREPSAERLADQAQLARFLDECIKRIDGARIQSTVLLLAFNAWSKAGGGAEWNGRRLAYAMSACGFKKDKSSVMFWNGLSLLRSAADFAMRGESD